MESRETPHQGLEQDEPDRWPFSVLDFAPLPDLDFELDLHSLDNEPLPELGFELDLNFDFGSPDLSLFDIEPDEEGAA